MSSHIAAPRVAEADIASLRRDLTAAEYTVDHVDALLGPVAAAALHREQPTAARRVLRSSGEPAALLVCFFTLGDAAGGRDLAGAFPSLGVEGLRRLGLIHGDSTSDEWRAACDLRPYGDETRQWWLASDLSEIATGGVLPEDHVLGVGGASTTLARWTPRRPVGSALDLGTGCGVQAVHLVGHSKHVTATDLAERALEFVRFNAALNEMEVEVLAGSMLEPVKGRRFDLIVSNPPFVITPRVAGMPEYEYRDGGAAGDAVIRDLVRSEGGSSRGGAAVPNPSSLQGLRPVPKEVSHSPGVVSPGG